MDSDLLKPEIFFERLESLSDEELLSFINSWHGNEKPEELKAFIDYIAEKQKFIEVDFDCFDCAGTGGDKAKTFNITTCAAISAAAMGVKVTKNGGRSTTSSTGSVDVLEELGFDLEASVEEKLSELRENNLAFFSSDVTAKLLGRVKQLCKKHKKTSFINLLGPLTSPVNVRGQLIGVGKAEWMPLIVKTIKLMMQDQHRKLDRALIVHSYGEDFRLDELSTVGINKITEIYKGESQEYTISPEDMGIEAGSIKDLQGGRSHEENAQIIETLINIDEDEIDDSIFTKIQTVYLNVAALQYLSEISDLSKSKEDFLKDLLKN